MQLRYQVGDEVKTVRIEPEGAHYRVTIENRSYSVAVLAEDPLTFTVNGKPYQAYVEGDAQRRDVAFDALVYILRKSETARRQQVGSIGENTLSATMPGQVVKVLVSPGDKVQRGQTLIILEAMKMETRVTAPGDGRVEQVLCSAGQIVERGQRLVELSAR